jgi:RES domain
VNFDFIRNFEQAPLGSLLRASKGMLGRFIKFVSHSSKRLQRKRICSNCFQDQGLKLDAELIGTVDNATCYNCKSRLGRKLSREAVLVLSHRFFVRGSIHRFEYGYAPAIAFNEQHATDISTPMWLTADVQLIENTVGIGFFHYGPRLWMIGENYPLQDLQDHGKRAAVIKRILAEYPDVMLTPDHIFYRIRRGPKIPEESSEYDSPPLSIAGAGRLDSEQFPVLYGSQDLQVCIHECRVTAEDEIFLATIRPTKPLRLLDLSKLLQEDGTEFESLDLAIHMLLLAGKHSYPISRDIALAVHAAGYDGSYVRKLVTA